MKHLVQLQDKINVLVYTRLVYTVVAFYTQTTHQLMYNCTCTLNLQTHTHTHYVHTNKDLYNHVHTQTIHTGIYLLKVVLSPRSKLVDLSLNFGGKMAGMEALRERCPGEGGGPMPPRSWGMDGGMSNL